MIRAMDNESIVMTMEPTMSSEVKYVNLARGTHLGYYITIALVLAIAWWLHPRKSTCELDIPFYKASKTKWIFDSETLIKDSYRKFRDRVYQIKGTEGVQVLVPPDLVNELKTLPEDVLSSTAAVAEALQTKYTKFSPGHNQDLFVLLIRTKLTHNLTNLLPQLREELQHHLASEFPTCEDWTPVKCQSFGLRAIARLSGRAFVGKDIARQEQWMDTSINFAVHVFTACVKLQLFPEWMRPVVSYFVSDLRKVRGDINIAKGMLQSTLEERVRDSEMPSGEEKPTDFMQWLIDALPEEEKGDVQVQAELQLILAAAAIHTTNSLLWECLCDLATHPDAQEELRQEAYEMLEVEDGWAKKEPMQKLRKLDSFIKEVQRMRGNITGFIRKVMKPISLSDGTKLPPGTKVLAPLAGISLDERYFSDPETFDAFRFYRMRQDSLEASNRWQFTSLHDSNIHFGAGRHACPGRFFASNQIKLILAQMILSYNIRLKPGEKRPLPMSVIMMKAPNPNAEIEFKRR